ncbi:MAG TPA: VWA domain-containing protein [Thermoanaerobaculia bacterium]|nr:VWA domain-containing protein [Thermoanaerobaculia bacterium]
MEVRVVEVAAVVVDRRGRPVPDLTVSDFVLEEDGKPVEIRYFSAPRSRATSPGETAIDSSAGGTDEQTPTEPGPRRTVALLLDDRMLGAAGRRRALDGVGELAARLATDARFVIASYRDRLQLLEIAEPNAELDGAALASITAAGPMGQAIARSNELRRTLAAVTASYEACELMPRCSPCQDNWHELLAQARTHAAAEEARVELAVARVAEVIATMSGLDGDSWLVYPSESLPHRPGIEALFFVGEICASPRPDGERELTQEMLQYDASSLLHQLAAWANARGVRLFPIDAIGLGGASAASVDFATSSLRPSLRFDELVRVNRQSGLHLLAQETGGTAIFNSNRPLVDLDVAVELEGSYVMGFEPAHPATGHVHALRLELVSPKGRTVRYRRSYLDRTLEQRLADQLVSALYFEPRENPLRLSASIGTVEATAGDARSFRVPVRVELPPESLSLLEASASAVARATAASGRLRLWLAGQRADGERTAIRQETLEVGAQGLAPVDGRFRVTVEMTLAAGDWILAIGARDDVSQRISLVRLAVEVPPVPPRP